MLGQTLLKFPSSIDTFAYREIYKRTIPTPGRPIVSSHSYPTVYIAIYLDKILTFPHPYLPPPLSQHEGLPACSPSPQRPTRRQAPFHHGHYIVVHTFFFTQSLHGSHCLLPQVKKNDQTISTDTLLGLCELVLTTNDMQFNGELCRQRKGIAMGIYCLSYHGFHWVHSRSLKHRLTFPVP